MSRQAGSRVRDLVRDFTPYGLAVWYASRREHRRRAALAERTAAMRCTVAAETAHERLRRINVGCGTHLESGWWNLDASAPADLRHHVEVGAVLPFESESIDVVFSEHFIEHLSFDAALWFMKEAARVLRSGGIWRCSTPDLDWIAGCTKGGWRDLAAVYEGIGDFAPGVLRRPAQVLNWAFRGHGHEYLWAFDDMRAHLSTDGFGRIRRVEFGESTVAGAAIERRKAEAFYSLIVEATR